jgi:hypothetical protein
MSFTLTDLGPSPFFLVIGRSVVAADTDLETVAQQLLAELGKTLAHLDWVEPLFPTIAAGVDARQVEFRWRQSPTATISFLLRTCGNIEGPSGYLDDPQTGFGEAECFT